MIEKYKEELKYFLNNKIFISIVILVTILSFGFTIVNYSIGVDDTCLDRYHAYSEEYKDTNMLAIGRWGSFLLYNLFQIHEFTPFWLDLVMSIVIVITAIFACTFIKVQAGDKLKLGVYLVFACVYISYPLINESFIYQTSSFAVLIGILLMLISLSLIYESIFKVKNIKNIIIAVLLIILASSMYESCCEVFLVAMFFMAIFRKIFENEKEKNIFKYIFKSLLLLVIGVIINLLIGKGINLFGIVDSGAADKEIFWGTMSLAESIKEIFTYIWVSTLGNMEYFPVFIFVIASLIGLIIYTIKGYAKKSTSVIISYAGMFIVNFSFVFIQLFGVLYRASQSWGLFVAIIIAVAYNHLSEFKITKNISIFLIFILIMLQTKNLNQLFYNDYIRYQRDLAIAYELIDDLETSYDISKPLVIMGTPKKGIGRSGAQVNSLSVLWWGKKAFDDNGYEFIKFLNSLGYEFNKPTGEQYEKGLNIYKTMERYPENGSIRELDDCIIINF